MLSFKNIKKLTYSIALFSVLLFYSVPARPESANTALAQTILGNLKQAPDTQASLMRAFCWKDIVLNKQAPIQTPIINSTLIKVFGIYDMFRTVDANTITFFSGVALEDMLSNPSYTIEQIKRKQDIIASFVTLDDQTINLFKAILSAIGKPMDNAVDDHDEKSSEEEKEEEQEEQDPKKNNSLEMKVIDPAQDMLHEWVELQKKSQIGSAFRNNLRNGMGWYYPVTIANSLLSVIPIIGVDVLGLASGSAWELFSTIAPTPVIAGAAAISSTSIGAYMLPLLGFSLAYAALKTIRQETPACCIVVGNLLLHIKNLAELLKTIGNPLHHEFIEKLMGIEKIDPKFNEAPAAAALSIIEALYAVAQIDAYLALADLVRSEECTLVQHDEKQSTVNKTYLDTMYACFKEPKSIRTLTTSSQNKLKITLPETPSQETVLSVLNLFHVHYMAQALGVVPAKFKDEVFCPLHFDDMTLEIFTLSHKEKILEIPRTISFPIA